MTEVFYFFCVFVYLHIYYHIRIEYEFVYICNNMQSIHIQYNTVQRDNEQSVAMPYTIRSKRLSPFKAETAYIKDDIARCIPLVSIILQNLHTP